MSDDCRSISVSPCVIHSATARADARALLDPHRGDRPQALHLGRLAEQRQPVRGQREQAVDRVLDADRLVAHDLRHQLERVLHLEREVVLGERELGRRQRRLLDRGDLARGRAGSGGARTSRSRGRCRPGARTCSCPCRARSGTRSRLRGAGEARHRADVDHLVDAGVSGIEAPAMRRDPRAPDAAGDRRPSRPRRRPRSVRTRRTRPCSTSMPVTSMLADRR